MADHYQNSATMEERVHALEQSHRELRADLDANTRMTAAVKADTGALVAFTEAMKGFSTFCRWVGKFVKFISIYVAPLVLAGAAFWASLKGKNPP